MIHRPLIAIGFAASALALAACGGGSSGALTMPEYIRRADAACERGHRQLEGLGRELGTGSGGTATEKAALIAEAMHAEVDSLRALEPPPAQRSAIDSMLSMEETQIANVEALADATESGDQARVQTALGEGHLEQQRLDALAGQLGFQVCGRAG